MADMTLLYVILSGIILVLCVMVAITCLLVHQNRHIQRLRQEASAVTESRGRTRRTTQHRTRSQAKVDDDSYVSPRQVSHSLQAPGYSSPHAIDALYLTPSNKPYENVSRDSESGHSYESVGNYRA